MPKINKKTIKTYKTYPTLNIFKYENSDVFHFRLYVGYDIKQIDERPVQRGNVGHSLKTKNLREAEVKAKNIYKEIFNKLESGEVLKTEFDFDKDIVEDYFNSRQRLYKMKTGSIKNMSKERNQYYNHLSQFFVNKNYNDVIVMNNAIMEAVSYLKNVDVKGGTKMRDTTITKYMNIISQICQHGQKKGLMKAIPDIPTFTRINEEVPPYFPKDLKVIRNQNEDYYQQTEDEIYNIVNEYTAFLQGLKINRAGLNALNVKRSQFREITDYNSEVPIVEVKLFNTKNNPRVADVCEFWWVEQYWLNYRNKPIDEYIFAPEITNREQLYEKIRKTFVRVSAELGLYMLNGKRRPLTSIRHTNALKIYEQTHSIEKSAEGINTSKDIIKSNYLNYSDEWARNRFKALGYDKSKNYQNTLKSKNKVKKK
ncbi:hypothetical protein OA868_00130 [Candidatus Pelagibacter sp.]|nr:hypothetical protein [Candidatus Pelagibacter sp.]